MLRDAEGTFRAAYANASEDAKRQADALIQSASNYTSANPSVGRNNRLNQAQVYEEATRILRGEGQSQAPSISGGWGNRVINDFYALNKKQSTPATASTSTRKYTTYSDFDSDYYGMATDGMDLNARVENLANNILSSLDDAEYKIGNGEVVRGMDANKIGKLRTYLNNALSNYRTNKDARALQAAIVAKAKDLKIDQSSWDNYFGETDDLTPSERNWNALKNKGYTKHDTSNAPEWLKSILSKNPNLQFAEKDGQVMAFNKDWSEYTGGAFDRINLNQGDHYGYGLLIDDTGHTYMGNTTDITDQHWANDMYQAAKKKLSDKYNPVFTRKRFNLLNDYSDSNLVNEYIKQLESKGYSNPDASYTDVSKLFNGTAGVIAYNPDGSELTTGTFGELQISPNTVFMWQNGDGSFGSGTLEQAKQALGGFKLEGYDSEANEQLGAISDLSRVFEGAEGLDRDTKLRQTNWKHALAAGASGATAGGVVGGTIGSTAFGIGAIPGWLVGAIGGFLTGAGADLIAQFYNNDTIANKPQAFVDAAMQALKDPSKKIDIDGIADLGMTGSEFMSQFGSRTDLLETIGSFLQNAEVTLSPADQRYLRNLYYTINKERLDSESKTRKHQEGGILFAADGTSLFTNAPRDVNNWHAKFDKTKQLAKEDQDVEKAKAEGYKNAEHYRANKSTDLGLTDYMRFATMAQDAASIVASFVPGAGTGVAAGLGVTSMGTDLVADILDPAVSAGEVVKNLGMNAAFAGMGLIPGAKMGKVAKNIVKYAPKIMTAVAGLGIAMDESTQATFKKIGDGSVKFNREDWRNISHVLSLLAGATRGVRQSAANRKVKNSVVASDNVKLKGVKTADGKDFELPKQTVKDINAELAKANTPDDVKAIQQKYNNLPDEAIDAPMIKEGRLAGKYKLVGTEATADVNKTYDSMRELWNVDAKALKAQSQTTLGKAAIRFANRFGGGAYGANQRAMLSEGLGKINNMKYDNYNPLVDWQNLRNKAGMEMMTARPAVQEQFSNISAEAQTAHRKELADFANLRRKEMLEKAGVNEVEAQIRENNEGIAGLSRAIEGNETGITSARNSIDEANIELGKLLHEERGLLKQPRLAKSALTRAKNKLAKAVTATEAEIGKPLTLKKDGTYTVKSPNKKQKELLSQLNNLVQIRKDAESHLNSIPTSKQELQLQKQELQKRIENYQKQIDDLTNEQLGGIRQLQRREALRDSGSLENELRMRQRMAAKMNSNIQSEVNAKGIKLDGELSSNIRVSGQTIKKGATITSFEHLRTTKTMPPTGYKTLDLKRMGEIFPNLQNLRGAAYNPATNEIAIWEQGGSIESKYQHLRK